MLVRVSSGGGGIAEYLERGRKAGREFDRDLIDDRYVLSGDLRLVEELTASMTAVQQGASKYLHITIGFAERFTSADTPGDGEINVRVMNQAMDLYREGLMAAYDSSEYMWYAEAHIPKVTHDIHAVTGDAYERLPHIHIVLPMRNLLDGRYLNPMGHGQKTIQYVQAIQEVVNARLGLKSPLDAMRDEAASPALSRHSSDIQGLSAKQIREQLSQAVAMGRIKSFAELIAAGAEFGEVRKREGKDGAYVNIKPAWAAKGINIKEFTEARFDAQARELSQSFAGAKLQNFEKVLASWVDKAAFETRYLTASNRKQYHALSPADKDLWLAERIQITRELLASQPGYSSEISFKENQDERSIGQREAVALTLLQQSAEKHRRKQPPDTLARLRKLSDCGLVQHAKRGEVLLPEDAHDRLGPSGSTPGGDGVRRAGGGDPGVSDGTERRVTTAASTLAQNIERKGEGVSADRLKTETSPSLLLEECVRLYKLDPAQYEISTGRDEAPRIRHQNKHYNLGDFLTKHVGVSWADAKVVLENCHKKTLADSLPPPDKELWKSFAEWRKQRFVRERNNRQRVKVETSEAIRNARKKFKTAKLSAGKLPYVERQKMLAKARAEQFLAIDTAQEKQRESRQPQIGRNALYRSFLTELANGGNLAAVAELRRSASPDPELDQLISGAKSKLAFAQPAYKVDPAGRVTYYLDGAASVTDSLAGVKVVEARQQAYALAVRVAVARYGPNLTLHGDEKFMREVVAAAKATGLRLTIRDGNKPLAPPISTNPQPSR